MQKRLSLVCLIDAVLLVSSSMSVQPGASLYKRLGGYDAIAAVTDILFRDWRAIAVGPSFSPTQQGFVGQDPSACRGIPVQRHRRSLCYMGRDMKTAHAGLGITTADWDLSVKHLTATLDKLKVPAKERGEVLARSPVCEKRYREKP